MSELIQNLVPGAVKFCIVPSFWLNCKIPVQINIIVSVYILSFFNVLMKKGRKKPFHLISF